MAGQPHTKEVMIKGEVYIAEESITNKMAAEALNPWGRDGYGKTNYPTSWVVPYLGRRRRIYSTCHSNVGTAYVWVKGEKHHVS